eukprot:3531517-Amphidinium_carterae.1
MSKLLSLFSKRSESKPTKEQLVARNSFACRPLCLRGWTIVRFDMVVQLLSCTGMWSTAA